MVGCDWLHQETDIAFFELPQNFTRPSISLAPSWSIVMTAFDELNQVNQTEVKINRYNEMTSLACELGSIAFLRNIFRMISQALHHSRRLQAERIIRQHHHLLANSEPRDSKPNIGGQ